MKQNFASTTSYTQEKNLTTASLNKLNTEMPSYAEACYTGFAVCRTGFTKKTRDGTAFFTSFPLETPTWNVFASSALPL